MNNRSSKIQNRSSEDVFFNQSFSSSSSSSSTLKSRSSSARVSRSGTTKAPPPPPPPPMNNGGGMTNIGSRSISNNPFPATKPVSSVRPTGNYYPTGSAAPPPAAPAFYQTNHQPPPPQQATAPPAVTSEADDDWYSMSSSSQTAPNATTTTAVPSYYSSSSVSSIPGSNATNNSIPKSTFPNFNNGAEQSTATSFTSNNQPDSTNNDAFFSGTMYSSDPADNNMNTNSTYSSATYQEEDYENEPPLMEELGINLQHIQTKSRAVILPFTKNASIDMSIMEDSDMAGPIFFALLLGGELVLSGKFQFGYIYGLCMFGCFSLTLMLNLMSPSEPISVWTVTSILGYALLPVNVLAAINILVRVKNLGVLGISLVTLVILWCTIASTRLFERGCGFRDQRYLIGYPCALFYSAFVMITIF